jgi:uncharacterized protein (TIGR02268 family)
MLPPSFGAFVVLAFFAGATQADEPPTTAPCDLTPRIDLFKDPSAPGADVCVTADQPTTFVFDSRIEPGAVEFQPEGGLSDWAQGREGTSLTVIPKAGYLPGERVRVTVRFADGAAPTSASFWLVGHAARGARRVEVFRIARPVDVLTREVTEARADSQKCHEDKARLLSERTQPGGLMGTAWLWGGGTVSVTELEGVISARPGNALQASKASSFTFSRGGNKVAVSVAVSVTLTNPASEPWTAAEGILVNARGDELTLTAWQESPVLPGGKGEVVAGAQTVVTLLACPCTLKLWEAQGPRKVVLGDVAFPAAPKPPR